MNYELSVFNLYFDRISTEYIDKIYGCGCILVEDKTMNEKSLIVGIILFLVIMFFVKLVAFCFRKDIDFNSTPEELYEKLRSAGKADKYALLIVTRTFYPSSDFNKRVEKYCGLTEKYREHVKKYGIYVAPDRELVRNIRLIGKNLEEDCKKYNIHITPGSLTSDYQFDVSISKKSGKRSDSNDGASADKFIKRIREYSSYMFINDDYDDGFEADNFVEDDSKEDYDYERSWDNEDFVGAESYTDLTDGDTIWRRSDGTYTGYDGHTIDYVDEHTVYDRDAGEYHQVR